MPSRNKYLKRKYVRRKTTKYKTKRDFSKYEYLIVNVVAVVLLILIIIFAKNVLFKKKINIPPENLSAFQIPFKTLNDLAVLSEKYQMDFPEILVVYSLENDFFPKKESAPTIEQLEQTIIKNFGQIKKRYPDKALNEYIILFKNIFAELIYFPIPLSADGDETTYMYGDNWRGIKNPDNKNKIKDGADIFDRENISGRLPVVSMTDGTIIFAGWAEENGYTVEIQGSKETSYIYSQLSDIKETLIAGESIKAGTHIGNMGNSGNNKKTTSKNRLQDCVHIVISPKTKLVSDKFYINPYPFLRIYEGKKIEPILLN